MRTFKLGYANRTLGYRLPDATRVGGADIAAGCSGRGVRPSGHEHFNGSLVIPVINTAGAVTEVYGRKITPNLREGTPLHMYLPGVHRGVWNEVALEASREIILCEALIDALTFWCAGYRNVTAAYGIEGVTPDHLEAFKRHGTQCVLIAYDRDEAGDRAAEKLAVQLQAVGDGVLSNPLPQEHGCERICAEGDASREELRARNPLGAVAGKGHPAPVSTASMPPQSPSLVAEEAASELKKKSQHRRRSAPRRLNRCRRSPSQRRGRRAVLRGHRERGHHHACGSALSGAGLAKNQGPEP